MSKSINAMESLRSMFITVDVRSLKKDNFHLIGTEYDFIEYKFWKQFSGDKPCAQKRQPNKNMGN